MKLSTPAIYTNRQFNTQSKVTFGNQPINQQNQPQPTVKTDQAPKENNNTRLKLLSLAAVGLLTMALEQYLGLSVLLKGNPYAEKMNTEMFNNKPGLEFVTNHNYYINDDMTKKFCGDTAIGCTNLLNQVFMTFPDESIAVHEAWHKESRLKTSKLDEMVAFALEKTLEEETLFENPKDRSVYISFIASAYRHLDNGNLGDVDQKVDEILSGLPEEDYHGIKQLIREAHYFFENNTLDEEYFIYSDVETVLKPYREEHPYNEKPPSVYEE